jgi:hypothetical protein
MDLSRLGASTSSSLIDIVATYFYTTGISQQDLLSATDKLEDDPRCLLARLGRSESVGPSVLDPNDIIQFTLVSQCRRVASLIVARAETSSRTVLVYLSCNSSPKDSHVRSVHH